MNIAIVGGGISGLAAAWELTSDPTLDITIYEASDRLGGKIRTEPFAGRRVDLGPDAFLRRVPDALHLCAELGIDDLVSPAHSTARVWSDGELRPLPSGLVLGAPSDFAALERSAILSDAGLLRARAESTVAGMPATDDMTIGALIRSRYGDEVATRLVGPLLGGVAAGDIDEMSMDACVPQLSHAARNHTSMSDAFAALTPNPGPVFAAPPTGMGTIIDTLEERLTARGVRIELGTPVHELPRSDGVIIATDAPLAARLLRGHCDAAYSLLDSIDHASVVFTVMAFRRDDLGSDLDGSGFLVPRTAGLAITAASWSSSKWAHLDGDPIIVRVSMGHAHDPDAVERSDDEVLAAIGNDLHTTMGISADAVESRISRYRNGFPQYRVGHLDRVDELEATLRHELPHVAVTGMAHRGVGIPACIKQARLAAAALQDRITA